MKRLLQNKDIKLIGITLIAGLFLGWLFFYSPSKETEVSQKQEQSEAKEETYTCSMHPQIRQNKPGLCPICAMDLVPVKTSDSEEEHADLNEIQMTKSALALASVETSIVKKAAPAPKIQLQGKIKPDERRIHEIAARFGGRIEKLNINYTGQYVKKGNILGTIYSPELISAQRELLEAIHLKDTHPSLYKAARKKLKLWNLTDMQIKSIEKSGKVKTYFNILSPSTGTVSKLNISAGEYVKEGTPMFNIVNLSKVWVIFDAYESDISFIKLGDIIDFRVQSFPDQKFKGKVSYVAPFIDKKSRTAKVRIELNNPKEKLKPDMFAKGTLHAKTTSRKNEILIPQSSILWTGKRAIVYVKVPDRKNSTFLYREITLGAKTGDQYIVKSGLTEGEEIATNGVFKIDAAAQLEGKTSMMNPKGLKSSTGNNHGAHGHDEHKKPTTEKQPQNLKHTSFNVSGNCTMCKTAIEKAAKSVPGVHTANWNIESKELHISFNEKQTKLSEIHKAIAKAGYDTEKEKATKEAYEKLPACCKYTREK